MPPEALAQDVEPKDLRQSAEMEVLWQSFCIDVQCSVCAGTVIRSFGTVKSAGTDGLRSRTRKCRTMLRRWLICLCLEESFLFLVVVALRGYFAVSQAGGDWR